MQGNKQFSPKLFYQTSLEELVPENNFYRRLNNVLDLHFLYSATEQYYGREGQQSIDPVVFFKICLVGYLNNIISDRKLIAYCSDSLSIRLFIGYDIDEQLPWHSTISRTRQLYEQEVFAEVFQRILAQCVEAGLVSGHTQSIDSAFVKANASMDSLELKLPEQDLEEYLHQVRHISEMDKQPIRKAKQNKATKSQKQIQANKQELQAIKSRNKKWAKDQNQRPGAGNKGSKYTSNKTHYSPVDPDARISVKPGKARKLNYFAQMGVDVKHQVITAMQADYADQKDNQCLQSLTEQLIDNLKQTGVEVEQLLADAGYSSGENYAWLEQKGIKSYIPPHGTYKGGPEGFSYHKEQDYYTCPEGKIIPFKKVFKDYRTGTKKKEYRSSSKQCKGCPIASSCLGKSAKEKKFSVTYYREEYERNKARLKKNKWHKAKRMSTVEPVFGHLINFLGMRKVNTRGIQQANKCMLMAACAHNLKKLLKYGQGAPKSPAMLMEIMGKVEKNITQALLLLKKAIYDLIRKILRGETIAVQMY